MTEIKRFTVNPFAENTYIVYDSDTLEAMVVDPGMSQTGEIEFVIRFIDDLQLKVKYIVNTHLHIDHSYGIVIMSKKYGVKPLAHPDDFFLGRLLKQQAQMFGLNPDDVEEPLGFDPIGEKLTLGATEIEVIHTPGHSPGGICLYCAADGWVITGDTLFCGGIGRTDLPGGDYSALMDSLARLGKLPKNTEIYPGHGSSCRLFEA